MGTHSFITSCLKTPIDPCNNCPAPTYNRSKMYFGRLSTVTPLSTTTKVTTTNSSLKNTSSTAENTSGGIRSLAKLYDSIPDYCDINHFTEEEFYSTLESLRSTCRELRTKPLNISLIDESSITSTPSSSCTSMKLKKAGKKEISSTKKCCSKKKQKESKKVQQEIETQHIDAPCVTITPVCDASYCDEIEKKVTKSSKDDFQEEIKALKKTLKDYEEELKSRTFERSFKRARSTCHMASTKVDENTQTELDDNLKPYTAGNSPKSLRKAYSFNDINILNFDPKSETRKPKYCEISEHTVCSDLNNLSNFFPPRAKTPCQTTNELPKITIQSPSSQVTSSTNTNSRKYLLKMSEKPINPAFSIFKILNKNEKKDEIETPSPVHPVARPNLAATLRVEVSKKKLKELQNNCTFYDRTPHIDWEVRKTPAWRSLSLNESHKEILALRLATRKAEQALQEREYELSMELMRQRVKSAPLLLEGKTFWGPNVGKLTHKCQNEGLRHECDSLQRKNRHKKSSRQSHSESGLEMIDDSSLGAQSKLFELRKVYACSAKSTQSRNSQHSTGRRSHKCRRKYKKSKNDIEILRPSTGNDSGDNLSSLDRAFL